MTIYKKTYTVTVHSNGNIFWYKDADANILHREDGPACEYANGDKYWFINGLRHREGGPAIEYSDGEKHWYYHGKYIKCYSQEQFLRLIKLKAFW